MTLNSVNKLLIFLLLINKTRVRLFQTQAMGHPGVHYAPPQYVRLLYFLEPSPHADSEEDANNVYKELEKFKAKVRQISIHFGLPPDLVDDIQKRNHRDSGGALSDVINSWVRQEHNVAKFGYPCWRKVVEAAMGAGNMLQAKKIAKNHPGE